MKITSSIDTASLKKKFDDIGRKQIPFAIAKTLTNVAQMVKAREVEGMKSAFKNPVPYTLNSLFIKSATKQDLNAEVFFKTTNTGANSALLPEVMGGERKIKRMERWLRQYAGLPADKYVAPGAGARLDKYGNISPGQVTQILAKLQALPDIYSRTSARSMKRNLKPRDYFIIITPHGGLKPGVYERDPNNKRKVKPVLMFISKPHYKVRLPFFPYARNIYNKNFAPLFKKNLADAIRTAK